MGRAAGGFLQAKQYRNTIVHHFVVKAIAELALQQSFPANADPVEAFWNEVERLHRLFKFEFFYAPTEEFRDEVRAELERYDPKWERSLQKDPAFATLQRPLSQASLDAPHPARPRSGF